VITLTRLEREQEIFIEEFGEEIKEKYNVLPDVLYTDFNSLVKPYVNLITSFKLENKILQNQIANQLGVNPRLFSIMRKYFTELDEALSGNSIVMKFKSRKDVLDFIEMSRESGKVNAKLLEIQLQIFDDEYKNRSEEVREGFKLEVTFVDAESDEVD